MTKRKTVYVSHCYGGDPEMRRQAIEWVKFFASIGLAPVATWIVLTENGETPESRAVGLECCKAELARCDFVALCGPRLSDGVEDEYGAARVANVQTLNLLGLSMDEVERRLAAVGLIEAGAEERVVA